MQKILPTLTLTSCAAIAAFLFMNNNGGPNSDATAGPFDSNANSCTESGCHTTNALNSGTGSVTLDAPEYFYPGSSYTITVTVEQSSPTPAKFGFQTIALRPSNNSAGGTYTAGTGSQLKTISSRVYVEHTSSANTSGVWTFTWTAPNVVDSVRFFIGGLAANGNGNNSGDFVYSSSTLVLPIEPIAFDRDSTDASCFNVCDGSAGVTVTGGGIAPYSYLWNTGDTNTSISGLCGGLYTVTITDSIGNEEIAEITVEAPDAIDVDINTLPSSCAFGDGQITAIATGGTGLLSYVWNDSNNTTTSTIMNAGVGTFIVTVTDVTGCFVVDTGEIVLAGSGLSGLSGSTPENCGQGDGTASIQMFAGNQPFSFLWSGGQTSGTATSLAAGTYTVTVTDNIGCTEVFQSTVGSQTAAINTDSISAIEPTCFNGSNGELIINSSGLSPFTYTWSHDSTLSGANATGLEAGAYGITLTDAAGCVDSAIITLGQPDSMWASLFIISATEDSCDGSIVITMNGGTMPYSYSWSHHPDPGPFNAAADLCSGSYLITIVDSLGCLFVVSAVVPETLGIASVDNELGAFVPVPTSDWLQWRGSKALAKMILTNAQGALMMEAINSGDAGFSLAHLPSGIYTATAHLTTGEVIRQSVVVL